MFNVQTINQKEIISEMNGARRMSSDGGSIRNPKSDWFDVRQLTREFYGIINMVYGPSF